MNLYAAADQMTNAASFELSHCFGLAIPHVHENGRMDEKVLRFRKSKAPLIIEELEEDDSDVDTCWLETGKPGSQERIDALTKHYESTFNKKTNDYTFANGEQSAFVLTDDEAADRMVDTVMNWEGPATELIQACREIIAESVE